MLESREMGRYLLHSSGESFLKIGITLAVFNLDGN